jgi:sulfate permease, SulP family
MKDKHSVLTLVPFLKEMKHYQLHTFRSDLYAAFAIALLVIPQSIAYSLLAGLPPIAGFYSAIFGTIFASALGSSRHLVSGPTTGVAILIQTTITDTLQNFFPTASGFEKQRLVILILTHVVFIIGIVQIFSAFFNVGKLLQFVSRSVVLGYFAGIALAIVVNQIYYFSGIDLGIEDKLIYRIIYYIKHITSLEIGSILTGLITVCVLIFIRKKLPKFPDALFALVIGSVVALIFNRYLTEKLYVKTLIDNLEFSSPKLLFEFPIFQFKIFKDVFLSSIAIAFVAILEVFSVSRNLATRSGQSIYSNQEVFGLGISNFILSFFQYVIPASGSASRSFLNYESGAKTRFSAILSGILVAILILVFWQLIQIIPLAALAAILIVTSLKIINFESVKLCFRASRGDAIVYILTMGSCLIFNLDIAFFVGIVISIIFYLKRSAEPHQVEYAFDSSGRLAIVDPSEKKRRKVRIIGVSGELFFGTVDLFQNTMRTIAKDPHVKVIVLRLTGVYHVDASMCLAILKTNDYLKITKRHLIISGISDEVWHTFLKTKLVEKIGSENLFLTDEVSPQLSTWNACLRAKELLI